MVAARQSCYAGFTSVSLYQIYTPQYRISNFGCIILPLPDFLLLQDMQSSILCSSGLAGNDNKASKSLSETSLAGEKGKYCAVRRRRAAMKRCNEVENIPHETDQGGVACRFSAMGREKRERVVHRNTSEIGLLSRSWPGVPREQEIVTTLKNRKRTHLHQILIHWGCFSGSLGSPIQI